MNAEAVVVPYERQADTQTNRDCGAACLSMVYRSLGKKVEQAEIWPAIAKKNQFGSIASTTHLMVKDALSRGLAAVAFRARHPLQALRLCRESGARAILNHRPAPDSPTGHYSVLVDLDARDVVLHDPFNGPSRHVPHAELLELWQPRFPNSEIAGNVLIAIAAESSPDTSCWLCGKPLPYAVACPRCKESVCLRPGAPLGCTDMSCLSRMWNYICCPACDFGFTFGSEAASAASMAPGPPVAARPDAPPAAAPKQDSLGLDRMFAEIDKFCAMALAVPAAASHPEIKKLLDLIGSNKEKLTLAAAETQVHLKTHQEQLASIAQAAKQKQEAHRKKVEELNRPSPPLDAETLGRALLKNLGFVE